MLGQEVWQAKPVGGIWLSHNRVLWGGRFSFSCSCVSKGKLAVLRNQARHIDAAARLALQRAGNAAAIVMVFFEPYAIGARLALDAWQIAVRWPAFLR